MPPYQKVISPSETQVLRQKVTNWAALSDIAVLDSQFQNQNIKLNGKKIYRSTGRFKVGHLLLWILLGLVVGVMFSAAGTPGVGAFCLIAFPVGYVIYHFVQHRDRTVDFQILSLDSVGSTTVKVAASDDFDEVKADVNVLVTALM